MRMVGLRCEIKLASWRKLDGLPQPNQLGGIRLGLCSRIPILNLADFTKRLGDLNVRLTLQILQVRDE
jgi:hypothetical protein